MSEIRLRSPGFASRRLGGIPDRRLTRNRRVPMLNCKIAPAGPGDMAEDTISVRIGSDKKAALDAIAAESGRELGAVIEEALAAYLELHAWQVAHIEEGLRQADAGEFASEAEVADAFARWRR